MCSSCLLLVIRIICIYNGETYGVTESEDCIFIASMVGGSRITKGGGSSGVPRVRVPGAVIHVVTPTQTKFVTKFPSDHFLLLSTTAFVFIPSGKIILNLRRKC